MFGGIRRQRKAAKETGHAQGNYTDAERQTDPLRNVGHLHLAVPLVVSRQMLDGNQLPWTQIAAGVCLPIFAGLLFNLLRLRGRMQAAKNWDKVEGVIKIRRYQVDLCYAYQVGKRDFVGTAENWGWTAIYGLRELAEKAAGQYRQGQPVTVYCDPEQPGNAVLEPGSRQGSMAPLIFAAISAVVGGVFLVFLIKIGFDR